MFISSDLNVKDMSKSDLLNVANMVVDNFDQTKDNPLRAMAIITKMKTILETIEKKMIEKSFDDLYFNGGQCTEFGVNFQIAEVGTKYDYSENTEWVKIQNQITDLEDKRKDVEKFIKALRSSFTEVNEETGEIIKWHPPVKTSTTSIKKTIK